MKVLLVKELELRNKSLYVNRLVEMPFVPIIDMEISDEATDFCDWVKEVTYRLGDPGPVAIMQSDPEAYWETEEEALARLGLFGWKLADGIFSWPREMGE